MVCYIRKYVIILGRIFPLTSPPTKILGDVSPASPAGLPPVADIQIFHKQFDQVDCGTMYALFRQTATDPTQPIYAFCKAVTVVHSLSIHYHIRLTAYLPANRSPLSLARVVSVSEIIELSPAATIRSNKPCVSHFNGAPGGVRNWRADWISRSRARSLCDARRR